MTTLIELDTSIVLWPGKPPEVFCWFKATLARMAEKFHAPIFVRDGVGYILVVHPTLGLLAFDEGDVSLNKGNLEVYVSTYIPYARVKEELPQFVGEEFEIVWPYREQPKFS